MRLLALLALVDVAVPAAAQQPPPQGPPAARDTVYCVASPDAPPLPLCRIAPQPPSLVRQGTLVYPRALREAGIEGEVVVRMIVDTTGHPEPASVAFVRMPDPEFAPAVRAWVGTLEFAPARVAQRAVRVVINLPVRFSLRVPAGQETSAQLLLAARGQLATRNLDSAATLLRRVAQAPARAVPDRVEAWVLLGVVGFYQSGDSAAAQAFRQALALDPGLQATALERFDPALPQILAAERAALPPPAAPTQSAAVAVHDCLRKCPEGVRPPQFVYFPQIEFRDARQVFGPSGMRGFLAVEAVIGTDGTVELGTMVVSGSARGVETQVREGIAQARFRPGLADGAPVRTRVVLRFDFEAEGLDWVKYSYRVVAR